MSKLTAKQYVEAGGCNCPECLSDAVNHGKPAVFISDGDKREHIEVKAICLDCGAMWNESWKLSGMRISRRSTIP